MSMIITFVPLIVGSLLPLFAVDIAGAQAPEQIFRHMFNTLQRNQQTIIPAAPSIQRPQTSTSKPTIDCANIRTPLGLILCSDERAAKADWDVNAAAWAFAASLDDDARKAFWDRHDAWVQSVFKSCRLTTPAVSDSQRGCVVNVYRARTNALKSKLSSDALAETNLSPQQRADIQARLISLGFLSGEPDGEFGPNTRAAIKMFQHDNSYAEGAYLTAKQRQVLLTESDRPDWSPALNSAPLSNQQAQAQAGKPPQTAQVFPDAPIGQAGTSLMKPADATGSTVARTVEVTGSGDTLEAART